MLNIKDNLYIATFEDNALETARLYGCGLEFNHTCISEALDSSNRNNLLTEMRKNLETAGTSRALVHGPFTEICPAAIDYRARRMAADRLEEAYEVCRALGVSRMIVNNGWMPFIYFKEWQVEKGAMFWEAFMADKPVDFNICIENVLEDEPFMLADMMSRIKDSRIGICLDTGHANAMTSAGVSIDDWVRVLSPYIRHFHLHNNDGYSDSHSSFDEGTIDMKHLLDTIEKNCRGNLTFTVEARQCAECLAWLKKHKYI